MARPVSTHHSLRGRLASLALVLVVVVVAAVGLSVSAIRSWERSLDRAEQIREGVDDVNELSVVFSRQAATVSAHLVDDDPGAVGAVAADRAIQRRALERLTERELELDGLDRHVGATLAALDVWNDSVVQRVVAGDPIDADTNRQTMLDVEGQITALERLANAESRAHDTRADDARRDVFAVLFTTAGLATLGAAVAIVMLRRWVLSPLAQINTAALALATDEAHPLPAFDSAELQAVSDAVGSLQASLRGARDDAVAALASIEQSAVLAIQVRSELADEIGTMPGGWRTHTRLIPAQGVVAGDCFDMGLLDARTVYVVLIDVTGHGTSAALNALKTKSQLRAALRARMSPGAAIDWMAGEQRHDERSDLLTAAVAVIDLDSGRVAHANAGHPPAIITNGSEFHTIEQPGPLVGAFEGSWPTAEFVLEAGWTLLFHTDGLTDTIGADRERFGAERLEECLTTADPQRLLAGIEAAIERFRVGDRSDDTAIVAVHHGQ